ncbi:MAG: cytidine deaminase [Candidatus Saccharimonas sp.]|nr:cytidine deaminase [Planctomycetaceae bacterium]
MNDAIRQQLFSAAIGAHEQAYAPYSKFLVGAALLTEDGQIISGCNVENASYGLTICAERNAVFAAVAQGHRRFQAIALATVGGATPCGACRQVLAEFCDDLPILIVGVEQPDRVTETSLAVLLPGRFKL